jgi:Transposase IS200 like
VKGKLWGDSFWSDGYFYRSVGSTTAEAVQFYVQNSQRKHWAQYDDYETRSQEKAQARLTDF